MIMRTAHAKFGGAARNSMSIAPRSHANGPRVNGKIAVIKLTNATP